MSRLLTLGTVAQFRHHPSIRDSLNSGVESGGGGRIGNSALPTIANANMTFLVRRSRHARKLIIITDMNSQSSRVDVAMTPEEKGTEHRLGQDIKDTVEDGLGIGGDDVAAFAETPGDRVEEPEEDGPAAADEVDARDVGTDVGGMLASYPGYLPGDEDECYHAEGEEAPLNDDSQVKRFVGMWMGWTDLVRRPDQSSDQAGDDHDLIHQKDKENGSPR